MNFYVVLQFNLLCKKYELASKVSNQLIIASCIGRCQKNKL